MRLRRASANEGEVASTATVVAKAHLNALVVRTPKHMDWSMTQAVALG